MGALSSRVSSRARRHEPDCGGCADSDGVAGGLQPAGGLVDAEDDDRVGALMSHEEVGAGRVDPESAGRVSLGRLRLNERQTAGGRIDAEYRDAVVAAVRPIEERPRWMD